jgi:hypothetical protein
MGFVFFLIFPNGPPNDDGGKHNRYRLNRDVTAWSRKEFREHLLVFVVFSLPVAILPVQNRHQYADTDDASYRFIQYSYPSHGVSALWRGCSAGCPILAP